MEDELQTSQLEFFPINTRKFLESLQCSLRLEFNKKDLESDCFGSGELIVTYASKVEQEYDSFLKELSIFLKKSELIFKQFGKCLKVRLKPDVEITRQELETHSVMILYTPASKIFAEYLPELPVRIEGSRVTGGGGVFDGANLQATISIPNPFNPQRLFIVVRGTSQFPFYIYGGVRLLSRPYRHVISRVSTHLNDVESGCLEVNSKRNRIEFLAGDNYPDDNNWLWVKSKHHMICVRPGSLAEKDIEHLINVHEKSYDEIVTRLGIEPKQNDMFLCYVHEQRNEKYQSVHRKDLSGTLGFFINDTSEFHVIYNDIIKETKDYAGTHELVHAILNRYIGADIPHLWGEGLATFLSWRRRGTIEFYSAEMLHSGALSPLEQLLDDDTFKKYYYFDTYNQAAGFTKFLVTRYGIKRFFALLKMIGRKSKKTSECLKILYNKELAELEREWKASVASYLHKQQGEIVVRSLRISADRHFFYKDYSSALSKSRVLLDENDKDLRAFSLAGLCYFFLDDLDSAADNFQKALSLPLSDKEDDVAYSRSCLYLGKIFDLRGEREKAVKYYNMVLKNPKYYEFCVEAKELLKVAYVRNEKGQSEKNKP